MGLTRTTRLEGDGSGMRCVELGGVNMDEDEC